GIRDLSVIDTPPLDRHAVRTTVVKFNDAVVARGIRNELERSGQVFFVHNFVHNIGVVHDHLARIIPEARIAVAHGQMSGSRLEKIMVDFIEKRYDILLSTNIIESGLDISNVNTIFINNAHRMGLADLYQLRGRVGRSTRQAFAFLLVPDEEKLTRDARLRLKILEELTDLGSGFQIANYDLEIRGAGNLVGKEQSGNVNLIGFELYCDMLEETMMRLRNKGPIPAEEINVEINIPVNAYIPDTYIQDATQKLLAYKRLSRVRDEEELREMEGELKDRYGALPSPLVNLLEVISLKSLLTRLKVRKAEKSEGQVILHVTDRTPLDMKRLLALAMDDGKGIKLLPDGRIVIRSGLHEGELMNFIRNILMEIAPL
ncbi:MAG TPA: helicase-related protein, partial [Syntrophorhabdaceae bacterium]|nr:helicase-related protein [Syntrophorhabdaceae bacterium]